MTPEELAAEVAAFVAECRERVEGVGAQQYYRPGSRIYGLEIVKYGYELERQRSRSGEDSRCGTSPRQESARTLPSMRQA